MNKTLIIVDEQRGFADPNCNKKSSLYVKGGEIAVKNTVDFIYNSTDITQAIPTVDMHLYDPESYKEPDMKWPWHCMAFSESAGIVDDIIVALMEKKIHTDVFTKGNCVPHTEYGAFEKIGTYGYDDGRLDIVCNNRMNTSPVHIKNSNVIVCGIAGDYCVMNTIKNLLKYNGPVRLNISVYKPGIASIDGGKALDKFIKENNLTVIE